MALDRVISLRLGSAYFDGTGTSHSMTRVAPTSALKQQLGPLQFFAIAFGSIIGVGWMIVVGDWLQSAGPLGVSLAFLGSAGMIVLVGLCYAELATMLPVAGGEIAYTYLTSGPFLAYGVGWFLVLGYVAICAFEAVSLGRILGFLFPALNTLTAEVAGVSIPVGHVGVGLGGAVLIGGVNWRGVRLASQLQTVLTCILFLLTALFVGAALWKGQVSHLAPLFAAQSGQSALSGVFWIFVTAPLWYMGFDIIPQMVEEAAPTFSLKRLSIIIPLSIGAAAVFYVCVVVATAIVWPWREVAGRELPAAYALRQAFQNTWLSHCVLSAGAVGLLTTWNGFCLGASRLLYALGRARLLPAFFGAVHLRHATPYKALLFVSGLSVGSVFLGRDVLIPLVNVSSFGIAVAFLGVTLSLPALRQRFPDLPRPYQVPFGNIVSRLAAGGACMTLLAFVLPMSPAAFGWPVEWGILLFWILLGGVLWVGSQAYRTSISEKERRAVLLQGKLEHIA